MTRVRHAILGWVALALMPWAVAFDPVTDESGIYTIAWERGVIPMQVNLNNTQIFSDGTTARGSLEEAMTAWNAELGNVQFTWSFGVEGSYELGNDVNEIVMDSSIEGFSFGANTLAVAISYNDGNYRAESDVIFNSAWEWDGYRGALRDNEDIRRVATHELGHVLGLLHPDQADPPQNVQALMNSIVSDLDGLQPDDIEGGQFLYGPKNAIPRNDNFSGAIELVLGGDGRATLHGTNIQSTSEAGEPVLDSEYPGGHSVWWKWIAPTSGYAHVDTLGSRFDTVLGVFRGESLEGDGLVTLAINDDVDPTIIRSSTAGFPVEGGRTFYFLVDGWDGYEGQVQINLQFPIPPPLPEVVPTQSRIKGVIGSEVSLSVTATTVTTGVTYQWRHNNRLIEGATSDRLVLGAFANSMAGAYSVEVTDAAGGRAFGLVFVLPDYRDTEVVAWGKNVVDPDLDQPPGWTKIVAIESARFGGFALLANGTVEHWGYPWDDTVKRYFADIDDVVAIAAGDEHILALRANGTVLGEAVGHDIAYAVPEDLNHVVAIAAGGGGSLVVRADGTVLAWGEGSTGWSELSSPVTNVVGVSTSGRHSIVLLENGDLRTWNGYNLPEPPPPLLPKIKAIAAGSHSFFAVDQDGLLHGWGPDFRNDDLPQHSLHDLVSVVAGQYYGMGVRAGGQVEPWGRSSDGTLEVPDGLSDVVQLATSPKQTWALRNLAQNQSPVILQSPGSISALAHETAVLEVKVGGDNPYDFVWKRNGEVLENGGRLTGAKSPRLNISNLQKSDGGSYVVEVTNRAGSAVSSEVEVEVRLGPVFTQLSLSRLALVGDAIAFEVTAAGEGEIRYQWWHDGEIIPEATSARLEMADLELADAGHYLVEASDDSGVSFSQSFLRVTRPDATVVAWTRTNPDLVEDRPPGLAGVAKVVESRGWLALLADGTLRGWGPYFLEPPGGLESLSGVVDIAAGAYHYLALKSDGSVVAWGLSSRGETSVPVDLDQVVKIEADSFHSVALRADGSVVSWGNDYNPEAPQDLEQIVGISTGRASAVAWRRDGSAETWGGYGGRSLTLGDVRSVVAGTSEQWVVRPDGNLDISWVAYTNSWLVVDALTGIKAVAIGTNSGIGIRYDGTLVEWDNYEGLVNYASTNLGEIIDIWIGINRAAIVSAIPPAIITDLSGSRTMQEGESIRLTVEGSGSRPFVYEWRRNGELLANDGSVSGANTGELSLDPVTVADAGTYTVTLRNAGGDAVSSPFELTIIPRPVMRVAPHPRTVFYGEDVELVVEVVQDDVSFQWFFGDSELATENGNKLTISTFSPADEGIYGLRMSNPAGGILWHRMEVKGIERGLGVVEWIESKLQPPERISAGLTDVVQLASSVTQVAALTRGGEVVILSEYGVGNPIAPAVANDVVRISAGLDHFLALSRDGTVQAWGNNDEGQCEVPAGLDRVVDVFAGSYFSLAVRGDGQVVAWGKPSDTAGIPENLGAVVKVVAGQYFKMALRVDGTVKVWHNSGSNSSDIGDTLTEVKQIVAARDLSLAIHSDGKVAAWQEFKSSFVSGLAVPEDLTGVIQVATDGRYVVAQKSDGSITAWGDSSRIGSGLPQDIGPIAGLPDGQFKGFVLAPVSGFRILAQPSGHVAQAGETVVFEVAVNSSEDVPQYQWMRNGKTLQDNGRISGSQTSRLTLTNVTQLEEDFYSVSVSAGAAVVESAPAQLRVTASSFGPRFLSRPVTQMVVVGEPVRIAAQLEDAVRYQWRHEEHLVLGEESPVLEFGSVSARQSGRYLLEAVDSGGAVNRTLVFLHVVPNRGKLVFEQFADYDGSAFPIGVDPGRIFADAFNGFLLDKTGKLWPWGRNTYGELSVPEDLEPVVDVSISDNFTVILKADGTVRALGLAWVNEMGWEALSGVVGLASGSGCVYALHNDGTVTLLEFPRENSPNTVPADLEGVVQLSGQSSRNYAVLQDGSFRQWGNITSGAAQVSGRLAWIDSIEMEQFPWIRLRDGRVFYGDVDSQYPSDAVTDRSLAMTVSGGFTFVLHPERTAAVYGKQRESLASWVASLENLHYLTSTQTFGLAITSDDGPTIQSIEGELVVARGDTLRLHATVSGVGELGYQWSRDGEPLEDGNGITGSKTATLKVDSVDDISGEYLLRVFDDNGASRTEPNRLNVFVADRPVLANQPMSATIGVGDPHSFTATVLGTAPLTYQWFHDGVSVPGATEDHFDVSAASLSDAGRYYLEVSNSVGTIRSRDVVLSVLPAEFSVTATHETDVSRYVPGGSMTVNGVLDLDGSVTAASWSVLMPTGWSLQALADDNPEALSQPEIGEQDLLEWSWSTVGESPLAFRFTLSVPTTQRGVAEITSLVGVTVAEAEVQLLANPDPLEITPALHSADMNGDQQLSLSELLRVIELYNTRFGSSRTGRYRLAESSADGFEPDGRDLSIGSPVTRFHSADYSQDGRLSLSELLRVIELYNTRSGSRRTGAYALKSDSVDGFAPAAD